MDRGSFTDPPMSGLKFDDLPPLFAKVTRNNLARVVWRDFHHQPRMIIPIDLEDGTNLFWRSVVDEAQHVGPEPMVLVPYHPFANEIQDALLPILGAGGMEGFDLVREENIQTGAGIGYMGTINGVRVYTAGDLRDFAILASRQAITSIDYVPVHGDQLVDLEFEDGDDPERSWVRITVAQRITWAGHEHVQFTFPSLTPPTGQTGDEV